MRKNINGWDVMCNVSLIVVDVEHYMGILHTPEFNYPDMSKTIAGFKSIDPEIRRIDVYVNNIPDVMYLAEPDDTWKAIRLDSE